MPKLKESKKSKVKEEVAEEKEGPKRISQMTEAEKAEVRESLLEELKDADDQASKSKLRARLRKLGHTGGLRINGESKKGKGKAKGKGKGASEDSDDE